MQQQAQIHMPAGCCHEEECQVFGVAYYFH